MVTTMKKLLISLGLTTLAMGAFAQTATPTTFAALSKGTVIGSLKDASFVDGNYLTFTPASTGLVGLEFGTTLTQPAYDGTDDATSADDATSDGTSVVAAPVLNYSVNTMVAASGTVGFEIQMLNWGTNQWNTVYFAKLRSGEYKNGVSVPASVYVNAKTSEASVRLVWSQNSRIKAVGVDGMTWSIR
jgi:hypothetical protein